MDIRDRHTLKQRARDRLHTPSGSPTRLVLLHAGATAGILLLLAFVSFLLDRQIDATGGLSGLGTRSILSTVQTLLQYAVSLMLPFWEMGYLFTMFAVYRGESATPASLLDGFRRFGPVLRFLLLRWIVYTGLFLLILYPVLPFLAMTPLASPLLSALEPLLQSGTTDASVLADTPGVLQAALPIAGVIIGLFLLVAAPVFYRLRVAEFALAENPRDGAFAALRASLRMTRGNCAALLKLDLSFWWYYLLYAVAAAVSYGDVLLSYFGVLLPISAETSYFLFYVLSLAGQTALYYAAKNYLTLTYAAAYDALKDAPQHPARTPYPRNQPWSY